MFGFNQAGMIYPQMAPIFAEAAAALACQRRKSAPSADKSMFP
jgi:hypothetical protein